MSKVFFLSVFIFSYTIIFSQKTYYSVNNYNQMLILGIQNKINFDYDICTDSLEIITNNGLITKDSCGFYITPESIKNTTIYMYGKHNKEKKLLDSMIFWVKDYKKPQLLVRMKDKNTKSLSKKIFEHKLGLSANLDPELVSSLHIFFEVLYFSVIIFNIESKVIYQENIKGSIISDELSIFLKNEIASNQILFYNIKVANYDDFLDPVSFFITVPSPSHEPILHE